MSYSKIILSQVEKNDLAKIRHIINGMSPYLSTSIEKGQGEIDSLYEERLSASDSYHFSVRGLKDGFMLTSLGIGSISDIDWVSRNGKVSYLMVGDKCTIPNTENAKDGMLQLLDFAFEELNLNKVYMHIVDGDSVLDVLSEFGFVAEGNLREVVFKKGSFLDVTVFSLLSQEFRAGE